MALDFSRPRRLEGVSLRRRRMVEARVRAIIVHRRFPDICDGRHHDLALHFDTLDPRSEADVRRYSDRVAARSWTFDDVRSQALLDGEVGDDDAT